MVKLSEVLRYDFLEPRYSKIHAIKIENIFISTSRENANINKVDKKSCTVEDINEILEGLPLGFTRDFNYGLGLSNDYRFIIHTIQEIENVTELVIGHDENQIKGNCFYLNENEFHSIRRNIDKITRDFRDEAKRDKYIFTHNELLSNLNPAQFPEKQYLYKKDAIVKFVSNRNLQNISLSDSDQREIVSLVSKNKKSMIKQNPAALMQLHNEIELVALENIIERFEEMLRKKLLEKVWQKFFDDNSFILSMAFGYPSVKVRREARVGLGDESGSGDKRTDFLFKNKSTNNSALIEIKTPDTSLLNKSLYRDSKETEIGNVYSITSDFSGAINQVLDQKYKLQQYINDLQKGSDNRKFESYSVDCLLIIGRIPEDKEQKRFFELFRGNSRDVEIITFDELLEKLKQLHSFLSPDSKPSLPINESPVVSEYEKPTIIQTLSEYDDFDEDVPF